MNTTVNITLINFTSPNCTVKPGLLSKPSHKFHPDYHYPWMIMSLFVILVNAFVLHLFRVDRKLTRGVPANHLLLSLAVNDLLTGVASLFQILPFFEHHIFNTTHLFRLSYLMALDVSIVMLSLTSVIHLCLLAAERYLSIFFALQFKGMVTTRRVRYCIVTTWAVSCFIALIPITWLWPLLHGEVSPQRGQNIHMINTYFSLITTIAFALLPLIPIAAAYVRMFVMCKKLVRQAPDNLFIRRRTLHKEIKILFMYFVMFAIFLLLCVPFFSIRLAIDIYSMRGHPPRMNKAVVEAFLLMRYIVSAINPFIYTFCKQDFRRSIKNLLVLARICSKCSSSFNRQSNFEDGNETREIFSSIGTPVYRQQHIDLRHIDVTTNRLLLPRRSSPQIACNGLAASNL
eukprot:gene6228-6944_t